VKHSEFYDAVEATFGSALGRSYVCDLYLASLGATARDALASGGNPDEGWAQLSCPSLWERGSGISHYAMTIVSQ